MQFRFRLWRNLDCIGRLYWQEETTIRAIKLSFHMFLLRNVSHVMSLCVKWFLHIQYVRLSFENCVSFAFYEFRLQPVLFPHLRYGVHAVVALHQFVFSGHAVLSFPHSCTQQHTESKQASVRVTLPRVTQAVKNLPQVGLRLHAHGNDYPQRNTLTFIWRLVSQK